MTNQLFTMHTLDWVIVVVYILAVLSIGGYFARRVKNQGEFFVASKKLPWFICSLAFMTVLISAQDIVNYSQTGYDAGFCAYLMYIDDMGWAILFLAIGLPIYFLSGIYSVPEYMERRFDKRTRVVSSVAMLLFMLAMMSFNAYAIGVMLNQMFGIDVFWGMMVITVITAIYTTAGGIMSVMITDTLQAVLIFVGGGFILFKGMDYAGGFSKMLEYTPVNNRSCFTSLFDPNYPMLGMFFGGSFAITAAWYFAHQGNIQKILAARTLNQARVVTLVFMGILMPVGVLFTGTPGVIMRSIVEQGKHAPLEQSAQAFLALVGIIASPGILGLIIAFVLSAMMSTGSTYINSAVTIWVNDVWMQIFPNKSDRYYLRVSRISSVVIAIGIPIIYAQYFMKFDSLMTAFYSITSAVMPGMVLAVLCGIITRRIHSNTATLMIVASIVGCMFAVFMPDQFLAPFTFGTYGTPGASWYNSLAALVWAVVAGVIGQIIWHKQEKPDSAYYGMVFFAQSNEKLSQMYWEAIRRGKKGYIELSTDEIKKIAES